MQTTERLVKENETSIVFTYFTDSAMSEKKLCIIAHQFIELQMNSKNKCRTPSRETHKLETKSDHMSDRQSPKLTHEMYKNITNRFAESHISYRFNSDEKIHNPQLW